MLVGGSERDSTDRLHWRLEKRDPATGNLLDEHVGDAPANQHISSIAVQGNLLAVGGYSGQPCEFGDVNCDISVNAVDVQLVINEALGLPTDYDCDVNDDGPVNAVDVQLVINAALGIGTVEPNNDMLVMLVRLMS